MAGLEQPAVTEHSAQQETFSLHFLQRDLIKKVLLNSCSQSHCVLKIYIYTHTHIYIYTIHRDVIYSTLCPIQFTQLQNSRP